MASTTEPFQNKNISVQTKKRLLHDVKNIYINPLHSNRIYYQHDDINMLKGHVMIIGPKDTPYEDGFYFFSIEYPETYPFSPPKLTFLNQDGKTRFNPNLYKSGKVCLSILNTWHGDTWTSCQTLRSVLLTLVSLFNENPLYNEPNIKETNSNIELYNDIIVYKNIDYSICYVLNELCGVLPEEFIKVAREHISKHKEHIINKTQRLAIKNTEIIEVGMDMYAIYIRMDYQKLLKKVNCLIENII